MFSKDFNKIRYSFKLEIRLVELTIQMCMYNNDNTYFVQQLLTSISYTLLSMLNIIANKLKLRKIKNNIYVVHYLN